MLQGGSNEAVKEQKRQSSLEDNYNFMFSQTVAQDAAASGTSHTDGDVMADDHGDVSSNGASPTIAADENGDVSSDDDAFITSHTDSDGASQDDVSTGAAPTPPKEEL